MQVNEDLQFEVISSEKVDKKRQNGVFLLNMFVVL